jgi:serine/threonine-protein kinase RsbW
MKRLHQFSQIITLGDVAALRQQVREIVVASGGDQEAVGDVVLALNEAIINSVRHGYRGQPGWLQIEIWRNGRSLVVKQSDKAPPFDPTTVPPPDTSLPLALRSPGGMGIYMMRSFIDELHYERTTDGRNQLTFIKYSVFT